MLLVADSGSTKTDWALISEGQTIQYLGGEGMNPYHCDKDALRKRVPLIEAIRQIEFYGSGCTEWGEMVIKQVLQEMYPAAKVSVENDLLGAARALCGRSAGIVCILGTGSNSCYYDGTSIINNTPAGGYILGDEGSGTHLGRLLLGDILKDVCPASIKCEFAAEYGLGYSDIVESVYRKPNAAQFLASFAPFLSARLGNDYVRNLCKRSFVEFFERNIAGKYPLLPISMTGSIAYYFRDVIIETVNSTGLSINLITPSPIERLTSFYKAI